MEEPVEDSNRPLSAHLDLQPNKPLGRKESEGRAKGKGKSARSSGLNSDQKNNWKATLKVSKSYQPIQ